MWQIKKREDHTSDENPTPIDLFRVTPRANAIRRRLEPGDCSLAEQRRPIILQKKKNKDQ
jgi:hypothetical protein